MAQIIEIIDRFEEMGVMPFLACEVDDLGMLFRLIGKKLGESTKIILNTHTKNFSAIHYQLRHPSLFQKRRDRNCASYPQELCEIIYFIAKWYEQPELFNKFTFRVLAEYAEALATFLQSIFISSMASRF